MVSKLVRVVFPLLLSLVAAICYGGTLTVTSPANNSYLGPTNTLSFTVTGATASAQIPVQAVTTYSNNTTSTVKQTFTADSNGDVTGSLSLSLGATSPQGAATIVVTATDPNSTISPVTLNETVDTISPKFIDFSPSDGAFVKGTIHIRATIEDANVKTWTIQLNGQSIPNGSGSGNTVAVDLDTNTIAQDGAQTLSITATDQAGNATTQTINITIDRIPPVITVQYPLTNTKIVPGSTVTVIVSIQDSSATSVDKTGIDVIARKTDGTYLTRVTLVSWKAGTSNLWTGRIKYVRGLLPSKFELVVNATDKAGNMGAPQTISVTIGH